MLRQTTLEKQWDELMNLCAREKEYLAQGTHKSLVKILAARIQELAEQMGFSAAQIPGRNFRAEKSDGRVTRIIRE